MPYGSPEIAQKAVAEEREALRLVKKQRAQAKTQEQAKLLDHWVATQEANLKNVVEHAKVDLQVAQAQAPAPAVLPPTMTKEERFAPMRAKAATRAAERKQRRLAERAGKFVPSDASSAAIPQVQVPVADLPVAPVAEATTAKGETIKPGKIYGPQVASGWTAPVVTPPPPTIPTIPAPTPVEVEAAVVEEQLAAVTRKPFPFLKAALFAGVVVGGVILWRRYT